MRARTVITLAQPCRRRFARRHPGVLLSSTLALVLLPCFLNGATPVDPPSPLQDRIAIARVYYNRQTGEKPPFETAVPLQSLRSTLDEDAVKETLLSKTYGVTVTTVMVEAEIKRIQTTTLAPETLAELWAAVGKDPERFGRSIAKPLVVDRELRRRFDGDPHIHLPLRSQLENLRRQALEAAPSDRERRLKSLANPVDFALLLGDRRPENPPQSAVIQREPTYLADLDPELARVLKAQLTKIGDVSAVIEDSTHFMLYLSRGRSNMSLDVSCIALPKRSFEDWLAEQAKGLKR